jgi:hypothetical protein
MRRLRSLLAAFLSLAALQAGAVFHLWTMNELYSNADGSVQFLEMTALTGGQQFLSGHTLIASSGGVSRGFTFPGNLPGDTSGRRMLIATQGFAALNVVTPDYVVPNGFFFQGGGSINFAEFSDTWSHPALPSDGTLSLNRNGSTAVNSPRNFAGQTGTVVLSAPPPALNFQALWWNAPADSESGWGVNIAHQGDVLFATWFTYDSDGSGMWLVMSDGRPGGANTYTGALYRTTGPAFSSPSFNPSQVVATPVGSATFTFSDASSGSFRYTVNGLTQTKSIVRQIYASPVPTCTADASGASSTNFQDLWWRSPAASESGWGLNITHQGDILFATWFTYGTDGRGMWLVMSDGRRTAANTYSGALYRTRGPAFNASPWDRSQVVVTQAGTATLTFSDANNGIFAYTVDSITQSKPITRQVFGSPVTVCR